MHEAVRLSLPGGIDDLYGAMGYQAGLWWETAELLAFFKAGRS